MLFVKQSSHQINFFAWNINNISFGPWSEILEDTFNHMLGNEMD